MTRNRNDSDKRNPGEPVFLTPPGPARPPEPKRAWPMFLLLLGLVSLLGLAAALLLYRPAVTAPPQVAQETHAEPVPVTKNRTAIADKNPAQQAAEAALGEWLRIKARAGSEEITAWAPEQYRDLLNEAAGADALFQQELFEQAGSMYQRNSQALAALLDSKAEILTRVLKRGEAALARLDAAAAVRDFAIALAIDPTHAAAGKGLRRAQNLDKVLDLYYRGLALAQEKQDLNGAAELLQQAVNLDPAFTPANEALTRIHRELDQHRFKKAMGRVLTALADRNPAAARAALAEAEKIKPADPAVVEARQRLARLNKELRLAELRGRARQAVREERWADALQIHAKALELDPRAAFALGGKAEAERRLKLEQAIQQILAAPQRLREDAPLAGARKVLARAHAVTTPGPVLQQQARELEQLITRAATTVEVSLRSDNMTTVEIYHVGRFQPFTEYHLRLRPGTYTVVGRRPGFRDVRKKLIITPEQAGHGMTFHIRCEEPI